MFEPFGSSSATCAESFLFFFIRGGFYVSAKFLPHGGKYLLRERVLLAGAEASEKSGGKHIHRHGFINCGLDGPAAFAGVLHESAVLRQRGILRQRHGSQIEQPRTDHSPAPPHFRDIWQVEIVAEFFRQFLAGSIAEDVKALGISLHQSVFDAVVHHLDEMSGTRWPAMNVALFGGARYFVAARCPGNIAGSGGERFEDSIELLHSFLGAANHHAITAVQAPDAAAGADIHVVNAFLF